MKTKLAVLAAALAIVGTPAFAQSYYDYGYDTGYQYTNPYPPEAYSSPYYGYDSGYQYAPGYDYAPGYTYAPAYGYVPGYVAPSYSYGPSIGITIGGGWNNRSFDRRAYNGGDRNWNGDRRGDRGQARQAAAAPAAAAPAAAAPARGGGNRAAAAAAPAPAAPAGLPAGQIITGNGVRYAPPPFQ